MNWSTLQSLLLSKDDPRYIIDLPPHINVAELRVALQLLPFSVTRIEIKTAETPDVPFSALRVAIVWTRQKSSSPASRSSPSETHPTHRPSIRLPRFPRTHCCVLRREVTLPNPSFCRLPFFSNSFYPHFLHFVSPVKLRGSPARARANGIELAYSPFFARECEFELLSKREFLAKLGPFKSRSGEGTVVYFASWVRRQRLWRSELGLELEGANGGVDVVSRPTVRQCLIRIPEDVLEHVVFRFLSAPLLVTSIPEVSRTFHRVSFASLSHRRLGPSETSQVLSLRRICHRRVGETMILNGVFEVGRSDVCRILARAFVSEGWWVGHRDDQANANILDRIVVYDDLLDVVDVSRFGFGLVEEVLCARHSKASYARLLERMDWDRRVVKAIVQAGDSESGESFWRSDCWRDVLLGVVTMWVLRSAYARIKWLVGVLQGRQGRSSPLVVVLLVDAGLVAKLREESVESFRRLFPYIDSGCVVELLSKAILDSKPIEAQLLLQLAAKYERRFDLSAVLDQRPISQFVRRFMKVSELTKIVVLLASHQLPPETASALLEEAVNLQSVSVLDELYQRLKGPYAFVHQAAIERLGGDLLLDKVAKSNDRRLDWMSDFLGCSFVRKAFNFRRVFQFCSRRRLSGVIETIVLDANCAEVISWRCLKRALRRSVRYGSPEVTRALQRHPLFSTERGRLLMSSIGVSWIH